LSSATFFYNINFWKHTSTATSLEHASTRIQHYSKAFPKDIIALRSAAAHTHRTTMVQNPTLGAIPFIFDH